MFQLTAMDAFVIWITSEHHFIYSTEYIWHRLLPMKIFMLSFYSLKMYYYYYIFFAKQQFILQQKANRTKTAGVKKKKCDAVLTLNHLKNLKFSAR